MDLILIVCVCVCLSGFDPTDIVSALRAAHAKGERWMGVDIENESIIDTMKVSIAPSHCPSPSL